MYTVQDKTLIHSLKSFNLELNVKVATCVMAQSASCIGNVLTNFLPKSVENVETGLSDHFAQIQKLNFKISAADATKSTVSTSGSFSESNIDRFRSRKVEIDWQS